MAAVALIVFRESIEAALIISIVLAASIGIVGRIRWITLGCAAGMVGSAIFGLVATTLSGAFSRAGQELLNAAILLLVAGLCAWHNIWLTGHARQLVAEARSLGLSVVQGTKPLMALAAIAASAVMREGIETVVFIYGVSVGTDTGPHEITLGVLCGLIGGTASGLILYLGLIRIPVHRLLMVTGWMILLLSAGLAAHATGFLVQADMLPPLGTHIWDTSWILNDDSVIGHLLHQLIGYEDQPQGIQVIAYVATVLLIGVPMVIQARRRARARAARARTTR